LISFRCRMLVAFPPPLPFRFFFLPVKAAHPSSRSGRSISIGTPFHSALRAFCIVRVSPFLGFLTRKRSRRFFFPRSSSFGASPAEGPAGWDRNIPSMAMLFRPLLASGLLERRRVSPLSQPPFSTSPGKISCGASFPSERVNHPPLVWSPRRCFPSPRPSSCLACSAGVFVFFFFFFWVAKVISPVRGVFTRFPPPFPFFSLETAGVKSFTFL